MNRFRLYLLIAISFTFLGGPRDGGPYVLLAADHAGSKAMDRQNPLEQLFKGLFPASRGGRQPSGRMIGGTGRPTALDYRVLDQIDVQAPTNATQNAEVRRLESMLRQQNWPGFLDLWHRLMTHHDGLLFQAPSGRLVPIWDTLQQLMQCAPAEVRRRFREQYDGIAKQKLDHARQTGSAGEYRDIAQHYFTTASGQIAADWIGTWHLDRGEFVLATRWFQLLHRTDAALTTNAEWRCKAFFAAEQAGRTAFAQTLRRELATQNGGWQVVLGGKTLEWSAWLATRKAGGWMAVPTIVDWPMLQGTTRRVGIAVDCQPLPIVKWTRDVNPMAMGTRVRWLMSQLADRNRVLIPAARPVVVEDKVAFQTATGIRVLELSSGETLWETNRRDSASADAGDNARGVSSRPPIRNAAINNGLRFPFDKAYDAVAGGDVESSRLANTLFRDSVTGILSCDHSRLFVIEDQVDLSNAYSRRGDMSESDGGMLDGASNRLVAYDLQTGRRLWEIGGPQLDARVDMPLAGTYFLGPPAVDRGELYVVGQLGDQIRLFMLDPQTGQAGWSQLIAAAGTRIESDKGRRFWAAPVAVADGIVVCPTTVGWLVAVDRSDHSILWAYRYARPGPLDLGQKNRPSNVPISSLNTQWSAAAPAIVGQRVIFTPFESVSALEPDSGVVVCVDLFDGSRIWERSKSDSLYCADVDNDRVLLVGRHFLTAISTADGCQLWKVPFPLSAGRPSGCGVRAGASYHLAFDSGELWSVRISDGRIQTRSRFPSDGSGLGNLIRCPDGLLSLTPLTVTQYELKSSVAKRLESLRANDPNDPAALILEAETLCVDKQYTRTLERVQRIQPTSLSAGQFETLRRLRWKSLQALVRSDLHGHDAEFATWAGLAKTDVERFEVLRVSVDRFEARQQLRAAFNACAAIEKLESIGMVTRSDVPGMFIRLDTWLHGRARDLLRQATQDERRMMQNENPDLFDRVARIPLDDGVEAAPRPAGRSTTVPWAGWKSGQWRIDFASHVPTSVPTTVTDLPFWSQYPMAPDIVFQYGGREKRAQRLLTRRLSDNQVLWSVPLQSTLEAGDGELMAATLKDRLIVLHRGVLHAIDVTEQRLAWTHDTNIRGRQRHFARSFADVAPRMEQRRLLLDHYGLTSGSKPSSALIAVTPDSICYAGWRSVTVLDSSTGEVRWRCSGFPADARVVGNERLICVLADESQRSHVLRTWDGKPMDRLTATRDLANAVALVGDDPIQTTFGRTTADGKLHDVLEIRRHDCDADRDIWNTVLPAEGRVSAAIEDALFLLTPQGAVERLDLVTGRRMPFDAIPESALQSVNEVRCIADGPYLYFVLNRQFDKLYYSPTLQTVRVDGAICAYRRADGRRLWLRPVERQYLILDSLHRLPGLLMVSQIRGDNYSTNLLFLDKTTGVPLAHQTIPMSSRIHAVYVNGGERFIELRARNQLFRLVADDD